MSKREKESGQKERMREGGEREGGRRGWREAAQEALETGSPEDAPVKDP